MAARNQHRTYISFYSVFCILCNSQKFYVTSHFFCIFDVFGCDLRDSLDINVIKYDSGIKRYGCKDCHLTSGIQTFDICSRVCLGITQLCSKGKGIFKFHTILCHLCEDKVGRSVDDSHYFCHMIACQTFFQRTDDRNSTGYCCLKQEIHMVCFCCIEKFFSMSCNQVFVGCYYMFAGI